MLDTPDQKNELTFSLLAQGLPTRPGAARATPPITVHPSARMETLCVLLIVVACPTADVTTEKRIFDGPHEREVLHYRYVD